MPVPHSSGNFADLLDPRFQRIYTERFNELPDMLPLLFEFPPTNGRNDMKWSEVGSVSDWDQFTGTVDYDAMSQGYDTVSTPLEWTKGVQVVRDLFDDDQYNVMDQRPRSMADSRQRTRQKHGARIFNNAFSNDTFFYVNSEAVALCSDSHTTTSSASTANGFDNLITGSLTAANVATARIQMKGFRGDVAERISVMPDELLIPTNLYEEAFEIIKSAGKVDTAENNANVHQGQYRAIEWEYLTDTNNWWMMDSSARGTMLHWVDRIPAEFAMIEDFDTLIAKWRGYMRYSNAWTNWRFILGAEVS